MKISIDKTLQQYLEEFDLNEREIMIYITLLKTGPNTIMNLARETGIKRSTTHNNVEELIKKGLVSQTNYGERRMVVAEDPEKLKFLLEQKKWNVKKVEENLPSVISMINKMVPDAKENTQVEVKYYEGEANVSTIYSSAFSAKELRSIVNLEATSKRFPNNKELFINFHKKDSDSLVKEIVEESKASVSFAKLYEENTNFQFKPTNKISNLDTINLLLFDNSLALINLKDNVTGSVILNKELYLMMVTMFDLLWESI